MSLLFSAPLDREEQVVALRQQARTLAAQLGYDGNDQVRIATAVSEIARNAVRHGGGGAAEFLVELVDGHGALVVRISDHGPGLPGVDSDTPVPVPVQRGAGLGLAGAARLMDRLQVRGRPGAGTRLDLVKRLPAGADARSAKRAVAADLARFRAADPYAVVTDQNRELMRSLTELTDRNAELERISTELEDTNRGVVALYAELDTRAEQLRKASEMKSRFLSNMSHEFRTPLNSILALSRLLLDRTDGELSAEQEKQVGFILQAASTLRAMVDDLLDIAKAEAGKLQVRTASMSVAELFGALRGALKPLQVDAVALVIEDPPPGFPELVTDEGKVAQILRNLISNALKFTESGQVRLCAEVEGGWVTFAVSDTGVGIAPDDVSRIFDEFEQVDGRLQGRQKGTGLGLPLSRKLAELLGGGLSVESVPGGGSTFRLRIPARFGDVPGGSARSLLVIDDHEPFRYVVRQAALANGVIKVLEASNGEQGLAVARAELPDLVVLDLQMPGMDGETALRELRRDTVLAGVPVVVLTSQPITPELRRRLEGARAVVSKDDLTRTLLGELLVLRLAQPGADI